MPHGKEGSMLRREQREQARRAYAARALKKGQRNLKTSVALETKALGYGGVLVPAALVAVTATHRTMSKHSEDCNTAIEHEFRQLRGGSTKCCKVCSGPTPEETQIRPARAQKLMVSRFKPGTFRFELRGS